MTAKIQVRRDTTANWTAGTPPTLAAGEFGLDLTLKQLKIGDGSSNWTALPWLGGTLPYFASPNTNIDDATNRVLGIYRFSTVTGMTGTLPPSPIDIVVADGGINMMVIPFGAVVLQHLWTDGDGTQPQKSYTRIYDGAWRDWTPQNLWGVSATEGVNASVRSLTVKQNATVEGTLSTQGSVNIGDSAGDVGVFQGGTPTNPSQTFAGDTDTGVYNPAADVWAVATGGSRRMRLDNGAAIIDENLTLNKNLTVVGQLGGALNCGAQLLTNLGVPASATGAMRLGDINAQKLVSFAYSGNLSGPAGSETNVVTGSDGTVWTTTRVGGGATRRMTANAGNWVGMLARFELGNGTLQAVSVDSSAGTFLDVAGGVNDGVMLFAIRVP